MNTDNCNSVKYPTYALQYHTCMPQPLYSDIANYEIRYLCPTEQKNALCLPIILFCMSLFYKIYIYKPTIHGHIAPCLCHISDFLVDLYSWLWSTRCFVKEIWCKVATGGAPLWTNTQRAGATKLATILADLRHWTFSPTFADRKSLCILVGMVKSWSERLWLFVFFIVVQPG